MCDQLDFAYSHTSEVSRHRLHVQSESFDIDPVFATMQETDESRLRQTSHLESFHESDT